MSSPEPIHPATAARRRVVPFGWLQGYPRAALPADLVAGLTAAAVVLPKAMAYATVAGLPVRVGLVTAFIPPIVYAALGRSKVVSVSTTTTIAILVSSALAGVIPAADPARALVAAATLSVLVGLVLAASALLRLGFVATFISEPVLAGFKAGIGAVILLDQLPKLLGFHIVKTGFFRDVASIAGELPQASGATLAVSGASIAVILLLRRAVPRVPAALVAVALGIGASALLGLPSLGVKTIGAIPAGLPGLVRPDLGLVEALWPAAIAIALMSFTETVACGRAFADPGDERPAPNQELLATGAGNVLGGLLGAMPSGGGASQSLVTRQAGARTPLAGLVVGLTSLATLLFLAPVVSHLPEAALAAIVVVYSAELLDLRELRAILAIRRTEFVWAVVAFGGVLLLGTLRGITVAVITSMVALAYQASNPAVYEVGRKRGTNAFRSRGRHLDDESYPGLLLVRVEGRIFFGNTDRVLERIAALVKSARPRVIVLDCSVIFDLEYSALKMLGEAEERLRAHGAELWLTALHPRVRHGVERSPLGQRLGPSRRFIDLEHAVAAFRAAEEARARG
jgi:high affinity sulfate transporter 1